VYQRNLLLKVEREAAPSAVKAALLEDIAAFKQVDTYKAIRVIIDVDPY